MLILIVCFLASETLSEFWKTKVPVVSRNWHDLVFRLAEIGVAVWFPCALWNSMAPERLWLLNPRRLLARQLDDAKLADLLAQHHHDAKNVERNSLVDSVGSSRDCWICYDSSRAEPLIRPCRCTGDVSAVHHDCLSRWLVECSVSKSVTWSPQSAASPDGLKCKVCNTPYIVQETNRVEWERGFTWSHWAGTAAAVTALTGAAAGAWALAQLYPSSLVRVLAAGAALLVCYVALRFLGTNTVSAYHRARVYGLKILTEPFADVQDSEQGQLSTISRTVTVEIAPKDVLDQALKGEAK
ncbi:E3 ubiquitin-protein ligase MARCHF4-like isoform X3 [Bombyx mori]|uniref:E3 ubiquitin-protein ligase MARCHF4-like isoform X3 n=1 Tax=Bombyx mori TaxID=7091 RepID=UPI002ED61BD7